MPRRAAGSMPSATTWPPASASSSATMLRRIARWSSSSDGAGVFTIDFLERGGSTRRLVDQHFERRHSGVPFDEGRHRAEAPERGRVERPDLGHDARTVIVDAKRTAIFELPDGVAGEMDLADRGGRQRGKIGRRVPAVIAGADEDVVDVAQNAAAGALGDPCEQLPLRNRRMPELQVGGRVLDQNAPLQAGLELLDVPADDRERFFGHRQGKQVGEIGPADDAPRQMLGNESRLEPLDRAPQALQVRRIEPLRAAERQADAVQRKRIVPADRLEVAQRRSAAHVVLGVNLEPRHRGTRVGDRLVMRKAQPDPCLRGDRDASESRHDGRRIQLPARAQLACSLPPWILAQSPAGSSTKDWGSRAFVAWPAQEWAPSAQSFFAAALMPKHFWSLFFSILAMLSFTACGMLLMSIFPCARVGAACIARARPTAVERVEAASTYRFIVGYLRSLDRVDAGSSRKIIRHPLDRATAEILTKAGGSEHVADVGGAGRI